MADRTEVYVSSADWMPRNFHRRIEVLFPVVDPDLRRHVVELSLFDLRYVAE